MSSELPFPESALPSVVPSPPHPLSQRFEPVPRHSPMWLAPLALALVLIGSVAAWLHISDARDREAAQQSLISDTLSLEQQLRTRIESEQARLVDLAHLIVAGQITPARFEQSEAVMEGLRRQWMAITWLDEDERVVAQAATAAMAANSAHRVERAGLSAHLEAALIPAAGSETEAPSPTRGKLVVRYALNALLAQETPWWISQRHVVRLVDAFDELLATTAAVGVEAKGSTHRISFTPPFSGVYLELQQRRELVPWYRATPLALVMGVLALLSWATYFTWRQTHQAARAQAAWNGEVAWRRAIEDALTVGLRARDMDGRLLYVNRRLCELTGFSEAELVGRMPPMPYWRPDEIEEAMQRHLRTMAGAAPSAGYESRWRCKDGREIIVMLFEAPLIDLAGKQVGWLGSVVDVTGLRRAEALEQQRAERAADQSRLMVLGEIAASLAHELNQPLSAIASYGAGVSNALQNVAGIEPRILQALQKQGEQVARVGRIVERIRGFMSRRAPTQQSCDLRRIADDAAELLRPTLKRRGVELHIAGRDAPLEVDADPVLIEQVIVNLVLNAADALEQRAAPRTVTVDMGEGGENPDHEHVWVEVNDNGPGLSGSTLSELSTPFYSTKPQGMGLGLSICRSIIEAHVGEFTARDRSGDGSIFTGASFRFVLPKPSTLKDAEKEAEPRHG